MSTDEINCRREGRVVIIEINRPAVHNALNSGIFSGLAAQIATAASSSETGAIVLTGAGSRAFSAGADLDELDGLDAAAAQALLGRGQRVLRDIELSSVPVIAAVNGVALGGGFELALACSFAIASTKASFGLPETGLGLIPGYGGTQRLQRLVGAAMARYVILTGSRVDAERAWQLGLVATQPVDPDDLLPTTVELAAQVAARGPSAAGSVLHAIARGPELAADQALVLETELAAQAVAGAEGREGIAAFKERRPANFQSDEAIQL